MDRFIGLDGCSAKGTEISLKSNMDRFIDAKNANLKIGVYV